MAMTKDEMRLLAFLLEQHPSLYGEKSDRCTREKAIEKLCQDFEKLTRKTITSKLVKRRLNYLKTYYVEQMKRMRKSQTGNVSSEGVFKPKWWLFEDLRFLDKYLPIKEEESSIDYLSNMEEDSFDFDEYTKFRNSISEFEESDEVNPDVGKNEWNRTSHQPFSTPSTSGTCQMNYRTYNPNGAKRHTNRSVDDSSEIKIKSSDSSYQENLTDIEIEKKEKADGLKHLMLYVESELRQIRNPEKLAHIKQAILNLLHSKGDEDSLE